MTFCTSQWSTNVEARNKDGKAQQIRPLQRRKVRLVDGVCSTTCDVCGGFGESWALEERSRESRVSLLSLIR